MNMNTEPVAQGERQHRGGARKRGRGRGGQNNNSVRSNFNKQRMEEHRYKTGMKTMQANQDSIKSEIFAFVTNEQLEKLTSNVTKKSQMLPISTRTVGLATTNLIYTATQHKETIALPNIYQMFRVFLAALELKIIKLRKESGVIYEHPNARAGFMEDAARFNIFPLHIKMLIDAIGVVTDTDDVAYLPVIAQVRRDDEGYLQPRPENLLLSTLKETVKELADPETALVIRQRFHDNNPIPGAKWSNDHVLLNPNEIIPENYDINSSLVTDIFGLTPFMSKLQTVAPKLVGGALEPKLTGKRSIFISNTLSTLKVPDRKVDESIDDYGKRCHPEGDVRRFSYNTTLTSAERLEGQIILAGEYPSIVNCLRPLYYKRELDQHAFDFESTHVAVVANLYGM